MLLLIEELRLIAVNAVSLTFALISNLALLMNMARRLSFSIAQPITIIGWYLASIMLIGLVIAATYDLPLPSGEDRALTQAFYYAVMAAALYFMVSTLMVITVYGAHKGHYPKEFKLTMSQRTLMLQTISFLVYLLGGAAVYHRIESWKFLDAVYWADFTLLTVGIGDDYTPKSHLGRGLLFPYAIGGIVIIGLVIGSIRSLVLERGKKKVGARMVEKQRESVIKRMRKTDGNFKLNPLSKGRDLTGNGTSERERREEEFNLMRQVQNQATKKQQWMSLFISGGAWFTLWFIGAVVFWKAEVNQGWSYFESLYFSYTSLLTIGYGDFQPESNSGKAFFVFWSLLAVPTLTILISNMGDTVVKGIRDLTLYLGEITVLPGEYGTMMRIKAGASKLTAGKLFAEGNLMEEPPGLWGEKAGQDSEKQDHGGITSDRFAGVLEQDELDEAKMARDRGDKLGEDIHLWHFMLCKEIRNIMKHLNDSPPRKYSYEEWAWFLKLMGEDEASSTFHRAPHIHARTAGETGPELQNGQTQDSDGNVRQWSWIGNRSPLMGETEEAEWVLERLTQTLETKLKEQRTSQKRASVDVEKTPMSRGSSKTLEEGPNGAVEKGASSQ